MFRRHFSAQAKDPTKTIRDLKRHIHRLYKHIHPDRLARYPEHRAVNEASFQVLQSALERHFDRIQARIHDTPPQSYHRPQQLTFFAHTSVPSAKSLQDHHGLKKAVVKFQETNLGYTLRSLFESLGIDPPPKHLLPGHSGAHGSIEFSSLTDLVKHARRVITTKVKKQQQPTETTTSDLHNESAVARLALRRSRGVHVTLGDGLPPKNKQVLIFRRLTRTLLLAPGVNLRNLVIELDGGFDVHLNVDGVHPWLVLGACAAEDSWLDSLMSDEVGVACEQSRKVMTNIRLLESRSAKALGVRLVMHNISLLENNIDKDEEGTSDASNKMRTMMLGSQSLNEYHQMLLALLNECRTISASQNSAVGSLALMLEEGKGISTDATRGVIRAGMSTAPSTILSWLRTTGPALNSEFERIRTMREAEEKLIWNVKRALNIDSLRRGKVSEEQWHDALMRLRRGAGRLRGVLDGVPVVVGVQARLLDTGEVEVPFDFDERLKV